jgi:murein L,D-transpeptidase YcbB/YkuD
MNTTVRQLLLLAYFFSFAGAHADEVGFRDALLLELENLSQLDSASIGDVEIASVELIGDVYGRLDYATAWSDPAKIDRWIASVEASARDGFNVSDFHLEGLRGLKRELESPNELTPERRARIEILLSDSVVRLAYSQVFGKVNPYGLDEEWNYRRGQRDMSPEGALVVLLKSPSPGDEIDHFIARGPFYNALRDAHERYRAIEADGGWPVVPDGDTIRLGDADPRIAVIAERLAATGDIESAESVGNRLREYLETGVRRFQSRHGLEADGIIGKGTLAAMNVPASERVATLKINLERIRWLADDIEDEMIVVNIAGFEAYLVSGHQPVWSTRVQVGRPYHKTPVFRDEITYIAINPTWTVPYSIATKEMLPKLKKDPTYLASRDFDVKDRNGNIVDSTQIDWQSLSRGNFPYTLVQRPGPSNALGRVKFMFPNKYAVYLHDTPSKYLFERAGRAFSHGCIRTQNPFDLAELLLAPQGWDRQRIQETLDSKKLTNVVLEKPMPVLLVYLTARADPDGTVHFFDDVYERDQRVAEALAKPFSFDPPET